MAAHRWCDAIQQDSSVFDDFVRTIHDMRKAARARMDSARSWEDVLEARGRLRALDDLMTFVTVDLRERSAYEHYRSHHPG